MRVLIALIATALVLAACGSAAAPGTGLRGTILAGPACPGPARADSPCPDRPISLTVEVLSGTSVVATFTSEASGRFSVDLSPGTYAVRSKGNGPPTLRSQPIVVSSGAYTEVELHADTGIR